MAGANPLKPDRPDLSPPTYSQKTGSSALVKQIKKQMLTNRREGKESSEEIWEEKADQLRIYSGAGFRTISEAPAGTVCAVTGLSWTFCGQGLGAETEAELPLLEPVLTYQIQIPPECDVHRMYLKLQIGRASCRERVFRAV